MILDYATGIVAGFALTALGFGSLMLVGSTHADAVGVGGAMIATTVWFIYTSRQESYSYRHEAHHHHP
jgi:hypothetical protein